MSDILLRRILTGADLMTHDLKIHATEEEERREGGRGEGQDGTEGWREGLREEQDEGREAAERKQNRGKTAAKNVHIEAEVKRIHNTSPAVSLSLVPT